jgi:hypothetical protein
MIESKNGKTWSRSWRLKGLDMIKHSPWRRGLGGGRTQRDNELSMGKNLAQHDSVVVSLAAGSTRIRLGRTWREFALGCGKDSTRCRTQPGEEVGTFDSVVGRTRHDIELAGMKKPSVVLGTAKRTPG